MQQTFTTKQLSLALVSASGVSKSKYLDELGLHVLTLEDLLKAAPRNWRLNMLIRRESDFKLVLKLEKSAYWEWGI